MSVFQCSIWCLISFTIGTFFGVMMLYDIKFFNYALLFLIFDVETIFLYPFAKNFSQLGLFAFLEGVFFLVMLILALVYVIKKNVLRFR